MLTSGVPAGDRWGGERAARFVCPIDTAPAMPPDGHRHCPVRAGRHWMARRAEPDPVDRSTPTPRRMAAGLAVAYRRAKSTMSVAAMPVSAAARSGVHGSTTDL